MYCNSAGRVLFEEELLMFVLVLGRMEREVAMTLVGCVSGDLPLWCWVRFAWFGIGFGRGLRSRKCEKRGREAEIGR